MSVNATLLETLDRIVQEDFGTTILDMAREIDPFSQKIVDNSMGVTRDNLGRGWTKIQVFKSGLAGAASWRSVSGAAPTTTAAESHFVIYGAPQTFPSYSQSTAPAYVQMGVTLKELYGTFHVPVELMRLDQIAANIGNQFEAIIEGAAKRAQLREILAFWADSNVNSTDTSDGAYFSWTMGSTGATIKKDGTVSGTAATGAISVALGTAVSIDRYKLLRLYDGEAFDVFQYSSGAWARVNNDNQPVFLAVKDDINQSFSLTSFYSGGSDLTLTANYPTELHPFKSSALSGGNIITNQPNSLASWIKGSGSIFSSPTISLTSWPYGVSLVKALTTGETTLSEAVLNRYVGGRLTASVGRSRIDTLVTTPGVKTKYINNIDYVGRRERYATPVKLGGEGYTKDWDYQRDGYEMMIETSDFCPAGTLYGMKTANGNIQKVTPPSPPGTGKDSRFGAYVDFYAKMTGPSIFTPTRVSGEFSDFVEAPYKRWVQFFPTEIAGLKLTNLDEDIATS